MFCRAVFTYLLLSLLDGNYLLISLLDCTYFFGSCLEKPDIEKEMNALHYLVECIFYCLADKPHLCIIPLRSKRRERWWPLRSERMKLVVARLV